MRASEFTRASVLAAMGAWIGFLVGPNAMISASNSNFLAVLPSALHVSRTALSSVLALSVWCVALCLPLVGRVMDRFGIRAVIIPGVAFFGLCQLGLSQIDNLWQFAAMQVILSLAVAMHSSVGYAKIISLWFDSNRGLVMGLCVAFGAGFGQTVMPKFCYYVINAYGWRGGYMAIGGIILVIGLPLISLLARVPEQTGTAQQQAADKEKLPGVSLADALRDRTFYQIFFGIMLASASLLGTMVHVVPMLLERGLSAGEATTLASFAFAGVVTGQLSSGVLVDRINTPRLVLPYFCLAWVGLLVIHSAHDFPVLIAGGLLMGLGLGGEIGQNAYLVSRYFGLRFFGSIYGLTFAASNMGIGIGIIVMGWVRDHLGSYDPMRYVFGTSMALSVLCIALLKPFVFAPPPRR